MTAAATPTPMACNVSFHDPQGTESNSEGNGFRACSELFAAISRPEAGEP